MVTLTSTRGSAPINTGLEWSSRQRPLKCTTVRNVGIFRRSKPKHEVADPLEAAAEAEALGPNGVLGPQVYATSPIFKATPGESDIAEEKVAANADPEDDTAHELLIEREKDEQNPDY
jgi:hypothetical protein